MATKQDPFTRAKERIDECKDYNRDQHNRIREDLRFSNPSDPQQWRDDDQTLRQGRPTLTLDRTNQFIAQVVNDSRQNNPGMTVIGVDSKADPKVAETLGGLIRHIEYRSRASQAYDMAIELTARCGQGWLRVVPELVGEETNEHEIRILRVTDPTACGLDPNSIEADGSDAKWGYVETRMTECVFEATYPKARQVQFGDAWNVDGIISLAEYFEIEEKSETTEENEIIIPHPNGGQLAITEDQFWTLTQRMGSKPPVISAGVKRSTKRSKSVKWLKMSGAEVLDESVFPGELLPIIPVLGYELWVDGVRHVCGLTRRLMDGQRLHNYQMSAVAEFLATQPKAPFIAPAEAIEGYEGDWKKLNRGNPSYLPYNAFDENGNAIPPPSRINPPAMPGAYAQMSQFAVTEMEASVGMYKSALGQQSNAVSGRAKLADERSSDTSTFHFIDNLSRSIEQLGRVVVNLIPIVYDTERIKHIIGADDQRSMVKINPKMQQGAKLDHKGKVVEINPNVGKYDVRVKAGPSYTSQREETAQQLADMIQAQPQLAPVLGPMWARMKDMPESDRIARLLLAMAPPQVQALESEEDDIPPQAQAKIQQLEQQLNEMHQVMDAATKKLQELQSGDRETTLKYLAEAARIENDEFKAHTDRIKALGAGMTPEQVQALVMQTITQAMQQEPLDGGEELEQQLGTERQEPEHQMVPQMGQPMPQYEPGEVPEPAGAPEQQETNEPPEGGDPMGGQPEQQPEQI